jgi:serine/threonine protein kinase
VAKTQENARLQINGSPVFMSPEIFTGSYDKETDIWSLGVTLFNLASGKYPFNLEPGEGLIELVIKIFEQNPIYPSHFSSDFKDLLEKML